MTLPALCSVANEVADGCQNRLASSRNGVRRRSARRRASGGASRTAGRRRGRAATARRRRPARKTETSTGLSAGWSAAARAIPSPSIRSVRPSRSCAVDRHQATTDAGQEPAAIDPDAGRDRHPRIPFAGDRRPAGPRARGGSPGRARSRRSSCRPPVRSPAVDPGRGRLPSAGLEVVGHRDQRPQRVLAECCEPAPAPSRRSGRAGSGGRTRADGPASRRTAAGRPRTPSAWATACALLSLSPYGYVDLSST